MIVDLLRPPPARDVRGWVSPGARHRNRRELALERTSTDRAPAPGGFRGAHCR
jgi:hypothetical protein